VLAVGANCYVNRNTMIEGHASLTIGDRVAIGPNCYIGDFDHQTGPMGGRSDTDYGRLAPTVIGSDVWIGANCVILKGVSIGDAATIGAGSVVTRPVPAGAVAAGNPARPLARPDVAAP
jgi:maltose O-acetyltransferase